jgi:hypothetical protein
MIKDRFPRTSASRTGCKSGEIPDQAGDRPWARDNSRRREAEHRRFVTATRRGKNARPSWGDALIAPLIESLRGDICAHERP